MALGDFSDTTYPQGTMTTRAGSSSAAQALGLGGMGLEDILRMRERAKKNDMLLRLEEERRREVQARGFDRQKRLREGGFGSADSSESWMKDQQTRRTAAETQAMVGPPPTTYSHTFGEMGMHRELDPLAMNKFQREAFLPSNSGLVSTPGRSLAGLSADDLTLPERPEEATAQISHRQQYGTRGMR